MRTAVGKSLGKDIVIAAMDFAFIGGSMGSVVGEKIARAIDYSIRNSIPFLMISKSGGARMMEASLSLMQLVKTSAKLAQLADAKIPIYFSLYRPNNRWDNRLFRHVRRHQYCRTKRASCLCRPQSCKRHHWERLARRFPTIRICSRTRISRRNLRKKKSKKNRLTFT